MLIFYSLQWLNLHYRPVAADVKFPKISSPGRGPNSDLAGGSQSLNYYKLVVQKWDY